MYQNYIFDLYGTLIDINTDEESLSFWKNVKDIFALYKVSFKEDELKQSYKKFCELLQKDNEEIDILDVFDLMFKMKKISLEKEELMKVAYLFRKASIKYIKLYDGVIDLLDTLKKHNKKIYLLSNAQHSFTISELHQLKIYDYFDGIVISSDEKIKKPNTDFFKVLFERYRLNKNESIMIGNDLTCDINSAFSFNIDSLYIKSNISPIDDDNIKSHATFNVLDGNVKNIKKMIIRREYGKE